MSDRDPEDRRDYRAPELVEKYPPLPAWLASRVLQGDEKVAWVRGPWGEPRLERYLTHPLLFVAALALGALVLAVGRLVVGKWYNLPFPVALAAAFIVIGSVFVLAISATYFTRLVVT